MRKLPSETLRQYAERYWQLFNKISGIDEYWAARTFKNGLEINSKILDELAIRPPHGMGELMRIVERFCALEEFYADRAAQGLTNSTTSFPTVTSQLPAPVTTQQPQPKKLVHNIKEGKKRQSKAHDYPTGKLGTDTGQADQNPQKKCLYHNELGHYTTACTPYKSLLERLAAQGHLDQYIDQTKTPTRPPAGNPKPNEPRPTIHVIHGPVTKEFESNIQADLSHASTSKQVLAVGPGSKRPRQEKLPKWTINFTERNLERVQKPHSDALVVTVQIGVHDIKRVLVDQGSSVEVMYYDLFKKLNLPETALQPVEVPLIGFNGAPVWPLGRIFLRVVVGSKTLSVEFIVVNVPSPYNAILGRTWLHDMQAIASTYHQVVRFIGINGRQEDLRGDQIASKKCYVSAVHNSTKAKQVQWV
ncbi:uncharacterized protein LOC131298661 [Rhododendron vialii]|uniref:uncharacterized protein LOC131298661 n=1 Tax=Rhododendron vialii TaxID=182163 RepID=UPI00265D9557|nr:uncharacterized protein LOC131298661 [Rhododendron vialii]